MDSLVNDAFRVENGELFEVRVGINVDGPEENIIASHKLFKKIRLTQVSSPISWPYYQDRKFDQILQEYTTRLTSGTFLFPCCRFAFLRRCQANGRRTTFSDCRRQGPRDIADIEGRTSLGIPLTGAFSSLVNVDAIRRWVARRGGATKLPHRAHPRFDVYAFLLGDVGLRDRVIEELSA